MRHSLSAPMFTMMVHGTIIGAQILADIVMMRALGPELVGAFVTAFSIAGLVAVLSLFGTGEVAVQMHIESAEDEELNGSRAIVGAGLIIAAGGISSSLLVALGIGAALGVNSTGLGQIAWAVGILAINTVGCVYGLVVLARDLSRYDMPGTIASRGVLLAGVLLGATLGRLEIVFAAYTASALVHAGWRAWIVQRHAFSMIPVFDAGVARRLWRRGSRVGVSALFGMISSRADVLALRRLSSLADVGLYGALSRIVTGMQMVTNAVALALFPAITRAHRSGQHTLASRAYRFAPIVLATGLVTIGLGFSEPLAVGLFGSAWAGTGDVLGLLCLSAAVQVCCGFGSRWLLLIGREGLLPWGQGTGATVMVGALLLLVPMYGIAGAAMAALASDVAIGSILLFGAMRSAPLAAPEPA